MTATERKQSFLDRITSIKVVDDAEWHKSQMKKKFSIAGGLLIAATIFFFLVAFLAYDSNILIALTFFGVLAAAPVAMVLTVQASAHNHKYVEQRDENQIN